MRLQGSSLWHKDSREALYVRKLGRQQDESYATYRVIIDTREPIIVANVIICLIHQANYLLDMLVRRLENDFLREGGLRERMTRARLEVCNRIRRNERY